MTKLRLTDQELISIAITYSSRRDLKRENPSALNAIYKRGINTLALAHMQRERFYPKHEPDAKSRRCNSCGVDKIFSDFHKSTKGFIRSICKSCNTVRSNEWRKENPERSREIVRKSYRKYPEKVSSRQKIKREQSPHIYSARDLLKRVLKLTGERKSRKTEQMLGYTSSELKTHIESQFADGMSWENRSDWHIDHIVPVAVMVSRGITSPSIINALSNLRPLWAIDNLTRSRKVRDYGG